LNPVPETLAGILNAVLKQYKLNVILSGAPHKPFFVVGE
jgi:hypothetical protein